MAIPTAVRPDQQELTKALLSALNAETDFSTITEFYPAHPEKIKDVSANKARTTIELLQSDTLLNRHQCWEQASPRIGFQTWGLKVGVVMNAHKLLRSYLEQVVPTVSGHGLRFAKFVADTGPAFDTRTGLYFSILDTVYHYAKT